MDEPPSSAPLSPSSSASAMLSSSASVSISAAARSWSSASRVGKPLQKSHSPRAISAPTRSRGWDVSTSLARSSACSCSPALVELVASAAQISACASGSKLLSWSISPARRVESPRHMKRTFCCHNGWWHDRGSVAKARRRRDMPSPHSRSSASAASCRRYSWTRSACTRGCSAVSSPSSTVSARPTVGRISATATPPVARGASEKGPQCCQSREAAVRSSPTSPAAVACSIAVERCAAA
mmetsp:Transcript_13911/g.45547  ORF Transcript_13911/g.45547 Transcript_13911/m.45547 type:complete len:240 (+) Transcript_13911:1468-2187(+)